MSSILDSYKRPTVAIILSLLVLLLPIKSAAVNKNHLWSKGFGGVDGGGSCRSVAVDGLGNVIMAGPLSGTVDFGGGPLTSISSDYFVVKFDGDGNHICSWRFGTTVGGVIGKDIAVDSSENIIVTGDLDGIVDLGGGPLVSAGKKDIYVVKFDGSGNHIWSQRFGDASNQWAMGVAGDGSGNAVATGYFRGTVDFGGGPLTSGGYEDIFVAKFDSSGNHLWSQRFGDVKGQWGNSVAVDDSGNIFLTGTFYGTVDFGGGPLTSAGGHDIYDIFVVKFDGSGNHIWSKRLGDTDWEGCWSIAVDGSGNVGLAGYIEGDTVDFGGGPLTGTGYDMDIFVAMFDSNANHIWSQRFGDETDQYEANVAVDGLGNIIVAGDLRGTVDFGGGPLTSAGYDDIYVVKFDGSGNHIWSQRFGDERGQVGNCVASDALGNFVVGGSFSGTVDFGGGPLTGTGDIYIAKFGDAAVAILDIYPGSCPNPLNIRVPQGSNANGGVLPVAVLGSDGFNVHDINVTSLELVGAVPLCHSFRDIATPPRDDDDCVCSEKGVDGYTDLELKFRRLDVVAGLGSVSGGDVPVTLTGRMKDGTPIEATDCVRIVPRKGDGGPQLASTNTPAVTALGPATPNPFNPTTTISYELVERGYATLKVYDVTGKLVATLVDGEMPGGPHETTWEVRGVPSGVYFYTLEVGDFTQTRKMILLK